MVVAYTTKHLNKDDVINISDGIKTITNTRKVEGGADRSINLFFQRGLTVAVFHYSNVYHENRIHAEEDSKNAMAMIRHILEMLDHEYVSPSTHGWDGRVKKDMP